MSGNTVMRRHDSVVESAVRIPLAWSVKQQALGVTNLYQFGRCVTRDRQNDGHPGEELAPYYDTGPESSSSAYKTRPNSMKNLGARK